MRIFSPGLVLSAAVLTAPGAMARDLSLELFGGVRFEGTYNYNFIDYGTDTGSMFGVRGLYATGSNLSFGFELNGTRADYVGFPTQLNSTAIMGIARYTVPVSDGADVYATLGLGAIRVEYESPTFPGTDTLPGAQITLGAATALTDSLSLFGELTYQSLFEDAVINGDDVEYSSTSLSVGLRLRF